MEDVFALKQERAGEREKRAIERMKQKFIERKNDILKKFACFAEVTICLCIRIVLFECVCAS